MSLLFLYGAWEKERIARLDHAEEGEEEKPALSSAQRDWEEERSMIRDSA